MIIIHKIFNTFKFYLYLKKNIFRNNNLINYENNLYIIY